MAMIVCALFGLLLMIIWLLVYNLRRLLTWHKQLRRVAPATATSHRTPVITHTTQSMKTSHSTPRTSHSGSGSFKLTPSYRENSAKERGSSGGSSCGDTHPHLQPHAQAHLQAHTQAHTPGDAHANTLGSGGLSDTNLGRVDSKRVIMKPSALPEQDPHVLIVLDAYESET